MRAGKVSRYAGKRPVGAFDLWDQIKLATLVERFPVSWRKHLSDALGRLSRETYDKWVEAVDKLTAAERGGISPDATDADICLAAELASRDMIARLKDNEAVFIGREAVEVYGPDFLEAMNALMCRALLDARGMLDLWPQGRRTSRSGAVQRLCDPKWWRRTLRKLHARTVEACAIAIGLVGRHAGPYASNESVKRCTAARMRTAAVLESVTAVNDLMQDSTLSKLAAKSVSNKAIRRVELLTRIAGFEQIAKGQGHIVCMITLTCPSRFHRMVARGKSDAVPNPRYDGSTPHDGQRYLSRAWAACRAAAARCGLPWYGFRIAEPQHDGTPHWHCLMFMPQGVDGLDAGVVLDALVRQYFLDADSRDEPGAKEHRVRFDWIDWKRGSAVGYVIKYVSKNIDGHGVGLDLLGNDAILSSQRVEAWASTWRIRQFQQIGGPPVGVWRELRRVHPDNIGQGMPDALRIAVEAVNRSKPQEQLELDLTGERPPTVAALAWMQYAGAQGGVTCKRKNMRLRLLREDRGQWSKLGRYGEPLAPRLIGVDAAGVQLFRNHIHQMNPAAPAFSRPSFASVESERCAWVVVHGAKADALRIAASAFQRSGEAASTRIHVNNCTHRDLSRVSEFAPVRSYAPRLRRFAARPTPPDNVATKEMSDGRKQPAPH